MFLFLLFSLLSAKSAWIPSQFMIFGNILIAGFMLLPPLPSPPVIDNPSLLLYTAGKRYFILTEDLLWIVPQF